MLLAFWIFQSTRPHGGATPMRVQSHSKAEISIHAPAWGRDRTCTSSPRFSGTFQSTRPHGGATYGKTYAPNPPKIFQSTRPHGGATVSARRVSCDYTISIHAPAWGRDGACLHGLNYSGHAIFFANLIFSRAVTGIFRRKVLCVIRVRTEILRLFSRRRCLLQHQSSFSLITWFCTDVLRFSCVFIA